MLYERVYGKQYDTMYVIAVNV